MKSNNLCLWCVSPLLKRHSKKYCDNNCKSKHQYMNNFLDWYFCKKKTFENRMIRRHLETINGHICSRCSITEWNNKPIIFDVDHIDGDSTNDCPDNVRLLCPNCHSLTSTYSFKNKKGRYKRMYGVNK